MFLRSVNGSKQLPIKSNLWRKDWLPTVFKPGPISHWELITHCLFLQVAFAGT